jgi:hypothetical protein
MDAMAEDLIQFNGQLLPPSASQKRQQIVERITRAAERGWRDMISDSAWVTRDKSVVVAQVPTSTERGEPGAPIITCVRARGGSPGPEIGDLVMELTEFGRQAGYELDEQLARQTMEEVVRRCQSWPFRVARRLRVTFDRFLRR